MKPHPIFRDWDIPKTHTLGNFVLKSLNISDNDRDFAAIMESVDNIRTAAPQLTWPEGLTLEKNLVDLAWHQREFEARRSFAWTMETPEGGYLGCLYIYPSISGEKSADVAWWWKKGEEANHTSFQKLLFAWLKSDEWPEIEYKKIVK